MMEQNKSERKDDKKDEVKPKKAKTYGDPVVELID